MNPFRAISLEQFIRGGDRAENLPSKGGGIEIEIGIVSTRLSSGDRQRISSISIRCVDRILSKMWVQSVRGARANFKLQAGP